ncbi:DUF4350 domain-containing protein [Pleurocapsales cyanobacterium LEGE 10410]|nr:DUF4350 domain-containing protein [Pleurocapsales cyanobacterium LEGE 10410]
MSNFRQRKWLFVGIAIAVIVILILIAAPNSGGRKNDSGSTYGRKPDGYGAWYEYMSDKKVPIERWRKPFSQLIEGDIQEVTYVQIHSKADFQLSRLSSSALSSSEKEWVSQGNTLVIIGEHQPATAAPFKSFIPYRDSPLSDNQIEIETTRRDRSSAETLLGDRYGAVVWQNTIGQGKVIYCVTPHLAANAYQDTDNYEFLAALVSQNQAILVDEYIHGYKDKETITQEERADILSYLAQTPWFLLFIQTVAIAGVATAAAFRRFGNPMISKEAIADNSTAYIDALAGVLAKANSTDFVIDHIAQDERQKLQASLGLGKSLVEEKTLIAACKQQKSESAAELSQLLQISNSSRKMDDVGLIAWIQKWQKINSQ